MIPTQMKREMLFVFLLLLAAAAGLAAYWLLEGMPK